MHNFFSLRPSPCLAGYKKDCLCAVGAEQMDICCRNFNIATASGSVTVTDCSTILMLWNDPAAVIRSCRVFVCLRRDNQNVVTSRFRSPARRSVAGKWACTEGAHGSSLGEAAALQQHWGHPAAAASTVHEQAIKVQLHLEQCHKIGGWLTGSLVHKCWYHELTSYCHCLQNFKFLIELKKWLRHTGSFYQPLQTWFRRAEINQGHYQVGIITVVYLQDMCAYSCTVTWLY